MAAEQTVAEKIAEAHRSGRWDTVAAALAAEHVHQDIDRDLESVARSWVTEWERVHGRPELARGELEAFRAQAGRMTHLWARDAMVAPLERWSDDPQEAASIYCRNKQAIQADVFSLLDEYVRLSTVFLEIFGEDPDRIEALLRSAAIQGVDVPLVLGDRIQRLRERMRGLKRWKDQTRDLPVGLTDMRNATGTFIEPLEEGQRNVVDLVAAYLWEIPSLSSADETHPSVRDFHQQKDDLLEAIRLRQHHSASGRADMAELIAGLLHSQGLHELATPSVREGL